MIISMVTFSCLEVKEKNTLCQFMYQIFRYIYTIYMCVCIVDSIHAGDIPYHVYPRPNIILK